jgi:hypothetical protein
LTYLQKIRLCLKCLTRTKYTSLQALEVITVETSNILIDKKEPLNLQRELTPTERIPKNATSLRFIMT